MTVLVAGADRDAVRMLLVVAGVVQADETSRTPARSRNERLILDRFVRTHAGGWEAIDVHVAAELPHSHTSVRVLATILRTAAWYAGAPFRTAEHASLDTLGAADADAPAA